MMSLETIIGLSRDEGRKAARKKAQPRVFEAWEIAQAKRLDPSIVTARIPLLGSHVPKGWRRAPVTREAYGNHGVYEGDADGHGAFFVDASGFGGPGEPAMTVKQFLEVVRPGVGYGVVEYGQFQVKVGMFSRKEVTS